MQPSTAEALIFISIASYRDPQLTPTVLDCLQKASAPERLRFGICWQHGPEESALPFRDDPRFRVLDIPWQQSRGACWARARIMELFQGETWFLQIDAHSRFAPGWDEMLIQAAQSTGSAKPLLSSYPPAFSPADDRPLSGEPLLMAFQGFTPEGIPFMKPQPIPDWQHRTSPMRSRFLAAGFLFAPGSFVADVPYDPELYFLGEEITLTLRAFTGGYDLFHPTQLILWHDYVRSDSIRHWDDHTAPEQSWSALDLVSKQKVQRLLAGEPVPFFGLGTTRTVEDYEAYAGISFARRKAQNYTLRAEEPPNPEASPSWADEVFPWLVRIRLDRALLPAGAFTDPSFWALSVLDAQGHELSRRDFSAADIASLDPASTEITILCEFDSGIIPAAWRLWPVSRSHGWLPRVSGVLADEDFTILRDEVEEQ